MKFIIWILLICGLLISVTHELPDDVASQWKEDECRRTLREALDVRVTVRSPPKLSGHWTSTRCEVRPGPEFVLRKYIFRRNSFFAQLYFYADEDCSHVTHYINVKGSVKPVQATWRTPGGYETRYSISEIKVIPYIQEKAKTFGKLMRRYCKQSKVTSISTYRKFKIFQFTKYVKGSENNDDFHDDFDCSKLFNFTMNELQLIRIERRKVSSKSVKVVPTAKGSRTELFLGDISTVMSLRRQYVPTHYQIPLVRSKTNDCEVCRIITESNPRQPPILYRRALNTIRLSGEWVSQRCETRPNGQFLTRHLSFLSEKSWQGIYTFYRDPLCSQARYSIAVKGTFEKTGKSVKIPSAYEYSFKTSRLKVTLEDFQMVNYMNHYAGSGCGKAGGWKIGVTQDVTGTDGCVSLGLRLPHVEYEIIKTEYDSRKSYLYNGQRPNNFVALSVSKNRPTSFQNALVKCGANNDVVDEITPLFEQYSAYSSSDNLVRINTGSSGSNTISLGLLILCIVCVVS